MSSHHPYCDNCGDYAPGQIRAVQRVGVSRPWHVCPRCIERYNGIPAAMDASRTLERRRIAIGLAFAFALAFYILLAVLYFHARSGR